MKGRPPKTEKELKARGTFEKSRHADRAEIKPIDGIPPAPADFDAESVRWWNHFCADIQKTSVLAEQHLNAVRLMATLMRDREKLTVELEENGFTYQSYITLSSGAVVPGLIKQNPAFSLRKQIDDQLIRLYEQFGFTLRSGMTIKSPEKPKTSLVLEMMKGRVKKAV